MSAALSRKEIKALLRSLERQGCTLVPTTNGVRVLFPDGVGTTALHFSYSDHRSYMNSRADIRRAGLHWPFDGPTPKKRRRSQ